jgi:hypothetical protein
MLTGVLHSDLDGGILAAPPTRVSATIYQRKHLIHPHFRLSTILPLVLSGITGILLTYVGCLGILAQIHL